MALGSARLFGIKLTDNFNYPYFSLSIQDFWRRWHITLSTWILDYIFKPLQMRWRNYGDYGLVLSLIITFFACGVWHGLTLNYLLWGLYHGVLISISFLTYRKWRKFCKKKNLNTTIINLIDFFITFQIVCFSWLIFMTGNFSDILLILKLNYENLVNFSKISFKSNNMGDIINYIFAGLLFLIEFLQMKFDIEAYFDRQHLLIRWFFYYLLVFVILFFGAFKKVEFVYFQF